MAVGFSDYLNDEILDHILRDQNWSPASTLYVALFTNTASLSTILASNFANEVSATSTGYVRQAITFNASSGGQTTNSAIVAFPQALITWPGTVTYAAIVDSATYHAGNVYFAAALSTAIAVPAYATFKFLLSEFDLALY